MQALLFGQLPKVRAQVVGYDELHSVKRTVAELAS